MSGGGARARRLGAVLGLVVMALAWLAFLAAHAIVSHRPALVEAHRFGTVEGKDDG